MRNKLKKVITIDREKWLRGSWKSSLLNSEGKMCCLGMAARQCGFEEKDILQKDSPASIDWTPFLNRTGGNNRLTMTMMSWNDKTIYTDAQREKKLTELFKRMGVTLKFKN
jgi:hypothetical protein